MGALSSASHKDLVKPMIKHKHSPDRTSVSTPGPGHDKVRGFSNSGKISPSSAEELSKGVVSKSDPADFSLMNGKIIKEAANIRFTEEDILELSAKANGESGPPTHLGGSLI